jgi:outer membrane receptor protein involved in Fe transport
MLCVTRFYPSVLFFLLAVVMLARSVSASQGAGSVEGTLTHAATGQPVAGAVVYLEGRYQPATTGADGKFRLSAIPPGEYTLVIQRDGFVELRRTLTVTAGAPITVSAEMTAAPTVSEVVTVTASRHEEALSKVPVSIGTISGEELHNMRPTHVAEPLNRLPGVQIVAFAGEGTHNSVRQPLCCRPTLLMMEDGVPLTSPAFYSTSLIRQVDYAQAGRIEVLKGPGTAVHGSDGMTGVINFITQDAPVGRQVEVSAEAGGAGYQRALVSAGGTFGRQSLLFTGTFSDRDGRRHDPSQRKSGSIRWTALTNGGALFRTLVSVNRTDSTGSEDLGPELFNSRSDFNPYPIAFADFTAVRISTTYEQQAGRTSWSVTPFYRFQDIDFVPGWQLYYNPVVWFWGEKSGGLRSQVRRDFDPMDLRLTFGIDGDYTDGNRQEPRITPTSVDGVWVDWSLIAEPPDYEYVFTYGGIAGYAQAEFSPASRLRVTTGLRFDRGSYDYHNNLSVVQTGFARRPADAVRTFTQATPKFGVTYAVTPEVTFIGSYRRGFRVPTESHLFKQGSSANTIDLEPIRSDAVEGGTRFSLSHRIRVDATAYYMRLNDDILSYRAADGISAATNNGHSLHRGFELSVDGAISSELRVSVGYGFARHTFRDWRPTTTLDLSGKTMDGAPMHQRNAQVTYIPAALNGGRIQFEWQGLSDYWLDPLNTVRFDGYDVFHLRGSYMIGRRFELYARLMNIFDELYAAQAFMGDTFEPWYASPGEYRTLYAGVSARF